MLFTLSQLSQKISMGRKYNVELYVPHTMQLSQGIQDETNCT